MKIENTYKPIGTGTTLKPSATQGAPASSKQDAVSLSSLAGSIQHDQEHPVDMARIQEIKQAIAEGRFTINPEAIASGLIESARDLLNKSNVRQA